MRCCSVAHTETDLQRLRKNKIDDSLVVAKFTGSFECKAEVWLKQSLSAIVPLTGVIQH
ncbi:hypothetical protein ROSI111154_04110 [Rouxiella silvae]